MARNRKAKNNGGRAGKKAKTVKKGNPAIYRHGQNETMGGLPSEIISEVFKTLDPIRAVSLSLTCHRFMEIYKNHFKGEPVPLNTFIGLGECGGPARLAQVLKPWMPVNLKWNGRQFVHKETIEKQVQHLENLAEEERKDTLDEQEYQHPLAEERRQMEEFESRMAEYRRYLQSLRDD